MSDAGGSIAYRFSLSMEMGRLTRDGTAEHVSRDQILIFPVQLTTCRTGNLTLFIHTLATCVTIHSDVRAFGMAGDLKATVTALEAGVWVETVTEGERRVYGRVKERRGRRG